MPAEANDRIPAGGVSAGKCAKEPGGISGSAGVLLSMV
ncbi:hypothetical protein D1BOALGB6SA_1167 [Olavius sp. associated proteobacterium Delta 1]|nr:hypothetical protein D1BOALGB6SA_1167 [Olavius sp. associated proteobacterium Delta 1]